MNQQQQPIQRTIHDLPPLGAGLQVAVMISGLIIAGAVIIGMGISLLILGVLLEALLGRSGGGPMYSALAIMFIVAFLSGFGCYARRLRVPSLVLLGIIVPTALIMQGVAPIDGGFVMGTLVAIVAAHFFIGISVAGSWLLGRAIAPEARIKRSIQAEQCPWCQYSIRDLPEPRCPECWTDLREHLKTGGPGDSARPA